MFSPRPRISMLSVACALSGVIKAPSPGHDDTYISAFFESIFTNLQYSTYTGLQNVFGCLSSIYITTKCPKTVLFDLSSNAVTFTQLNV